MTEEETTDYFAKAASWATDQESRQQRALKVAWIFGAIVGVIAILEAIIILMLLPLKTVEPITLLVDRTTGFVQEVNPDSASSIRADEALTHSLLAQYVIARERFDRATVKTDYRRAALWSSGNAQKTYLAEMSTSNGTGPLNLYRSGESVTVNVKSVSRIDPTSAFVRFDTVFVDRNGAEKPMGAWISLVKFRFSDAPMSYEDRLINPLGLQIDQYRRDAEQPSDGLPVVFYRPEPERNVTETAVTNDTRSSAEQVDSNE